jgi:hypothetical protein
MSIVLELQQQAIDSNSDILSLLRKALLVARKLGLKDLQEWIDNELNGYKDISKIPTYRQIHGELKAWTPYNGWITVVMPDDECEKTFSQRRLFDSIPSLYSLLNEKRLVIPVNASGAAIISRLTGFETKYILQISPNAINDIIEQVKNKILDWAIVLEENGIMGEGISFTTEEKSRAQGEPQIVNYISNFYSSVSDLQFQQGTDNSRQQK